MEDTKLKMLENPAVQFHITMLQRIISRMANNSANCKTWTIMVVTTLLVLIVNQEQYKYIWICAIPIILFYILDCFYLGLERLLIQSQNHFLTQLDQNTINTDDFYKMPVVTNKCSQLIGMFKAMCSFSTTPFYVLISVVIYVCIIL